MSVFIISAPSGSGKSTLVTGLLRRMPGQLRFSISYTTRARRGAEVHGKDYYFVSREEFEERIARGEFLEHAEVFGNYYGTHCSEVDRAEAAGQDLVLDIDVQGSLQVQEKLKAAVTIFVLAPSRQVLEQRLRARGDTSEEVIARRLKGAAEEIGNYHRYDYVLINRDVDASIDTLCAIFKAERVRRSRIEGEVLPILRTFGY